MDDVQINANELINAFTKEASELLRRAVIAEQKFAATAQEVARMRSETARLQMTIDQLQATVTQLQEAKAAAPARAARKRPSST